MASATPTTIAHYRLTAKLGAGGMGEVWRATDTKLQREVAIKLLPPVFASDPGRLARFTREAHVLASLNHPNIAHVYGVEQNALVMELVEGETLAERIARGPLPLDEALPIASQIADGLEYAHDNGIVHRDLKPANIKLTPDGKVKVLDFGLAKAVATETAAEVSATAPTLTTPATLAGAILGTAAYMAPEQAKGRPVDRRADIWAYGVVLYEMLVGRRPFLGDDISDTLAAVLRSEPDLDPLPARVRPPIARSLKKDPRQRWGCIGDLRHALLEDATPAAAAPGARRSFWLAAAIGVPIVLLALFLSWSLRPPPPAAAPVDRFSFALPSGQAFTRTGEHVMAISADGSKIVYVANLHLYVRALNALDAQPIPGGPTDPYEPVISPDGQWVAYFINAASNLLQKIPLAGGAPVTLCQLKGEPAGASWSDGRIVFGDFIPGGYSAIESVPASGGAPQVLATAPAGAIATDPQLVDHGRRVLFAVVPDFAPAAADNGQIVVQGFGAPTSRRTLLTGGTNPLLLASGQLVYVHAGALYGLAFDASRGAVRGGPVPLVEDITQTNGEHTGQIAVSASGTLVYWPGGIPVQQSVLVWVDQQGREQPLAAPPHPYDYPRLSPDGKRVAVNFLESNGDIWIWDTVRSTLSRLTFGPGTQLYPYWSADGREVYYDSMPGLTLFRKPADGTGAAAAVGVGVTAVYYVSPDASWRFCAAAVPRMAWCSRSSRPAPAPSRC
ncbi:MAG: protein kinase domain-containing protein [Terriglobales bacterium]